MLPLLFALAAPQHGSKHSTRPHSLDDASPLLPDGQEANITNLQQEASIQAEQEDNSTNVSFVDHPYPPRPPWSPPPFPPPPSPPEVWSRLHDTSSTCNAKHLEGGTPKPEIRFQLGFEMRWSSTGAFDDVWVDHYVADATRTMPCSFSVYSAVTRASKLAIALRNVTLPGGGRRVRYFPSDSGLKHLWGCNESNYGYDCSEEAVVPEVCPVGAPPLPSLVPFPSRTLRRSCSR